MKHLYLFTLEIVPLGAGREYDELPPHLTLMSRFLSEMPPKELAAKVRPLFATTPPVHIVFDETITLGPKKVIAHMVNSSEEQHLYNGLLELLDTLKVEYQYPQFTGSGHKPHVTAREEVQFDPGSEYIASAAYLIEVVRKKRVVRAKFNLGAA